MKETMKKVGKTMQLLFWLDRGVFVLICVIRSIRRISKLMPPSCYKEGCFCCVTISQDAFVFDR